MGIYLGLGCVLIEYEATNLHPSRERDTYNEETADALLLLSRPAKVSINRGNVGPTISPWPQRGSFRRVLGDGRAPDPVCDRPEWSTRCLPGAGGRDPRRPPLH